MIETAKTHVDLDILVLQIESVLPDIDTNDWHKAQERVLVRGGRDFETLGLGVVPQPSPTRSLDASSGSVELLLEVLEVTESSLNGGLERTVLEDTSLTLVRRGRGSEVLPKERVVDVTLCREQRVTRGEQSSGEGRVDGRGGISRALEKIGARSD